jgi:signal transduction histidine kinase
MRLTAMAPHAFGGTEETIYVSTRILAVVYTALVPLHVVVLSGVAQWVMVPAAALSAVASLLCALRLASASATMLDRMVWFVCAVPISNSVLHVAVTGDIAPTDMVMLSIVGIGAVATELRPALVLTSVGLATWGAVVLTGGPYPEGDVLKNAINLALASALAFAVFCIRALTGERLATVNDHLERANSFKADLMGMLGHEIGNPLTSVTGYAQVATDELAAGDLAGAKRSLHVVERNADRIRTVLDEILTHAAGDTEALVARPERCLVEPHLVAAVAAFPDGHRSQVECASGLAVQVQPGHLDQILANLVSNAYKYAGGAFRVSAAPVDGRVHIRVTDEGPGVPDRFRERLFDRFTRDSPTIDRTPGTGLGLFITRQLARANGGDVTYEATEPAGSTFTLVLPCPTESDPGHSPLR